MVPPRLRRPTSAATAGAPLLLAVLAAAVLLAPPPRGLCLPDAAAYRRGCARGGGSHPTRATVEWVTAKAGETVAALNELTMTMPSSTAVLADTQSAQRLLLGLTAGSNGLAEAMEVLAATVTSQLP